MVRMMGSVEEPVARVTNSAASWAGRTVGSAWTEERSVTKGMMAVKYMLL